MSESRTTIGPSSKVSVALLGGIFVVSLAATAGGAAWAERVDHRLESIENTLHTATMNRWTSVDMQRWVQHLQDLNPELKVPASQ